MYTVSFAELQRCWKESHLGRMGTVNHLGRMRTVNKKKSL